MYEMELYHYGIKGQRWGIRRYQNEDGSLTSAGKARYGTIENFERSKDYQKIMKKDATKVIKQIKKSHTNSDAVYDQIDKEFNETDARKRFNDFSSKYGGKTLTGSKEILQQYVDAYNKLIDDNNNAYTNIFKKYEDRLGSALLKDLGEKDTAAGRAWIKKLNIGI